MSTARRRRAPKRPTARGRQAPARDFWGTDAADDATGDVVPTSVVDPTALVDSLGPPPFPGGQIATHYFDAVYDRAAALALALAVAADLTEAPPPE